MTDVLWLRTRVEQSFAQERDESVEFVARQRLRGAY
jgi:hypothetical protein